MVTIPFKSFAKAFAALLAFAAALAACEPFETISGTPRSQTEHPAEEEIRESNLDEHVDTVIYLAALEFEEGYDWSKDTVLRDVPATAVLLKRDPVKKTISRVTQFPAGLASSPDPLFYADGHLYSVLSQDGQRIVCEDGTERFRWEGDERVEGLLPSPEGIATLGLSPKGIFYRIDGEALVAQAGGSLLHGLHKDGESVVFFYEVPDENVGTRVPHRFKVVNRQVEEIGGNSSGAIYDIMMANGKLCILSRQNIRVSMRIAVENQSTPVKRTAQTAADIRLLRARESVYACMQDVVNYPETKSILWGPDGTDLYEEGNVAFFPDTCRTAAPGRVGLVRLSGDGRVQAFGMTGPDESGWETIPSEGSRFLSRDCAVCLGGTLFAAFSRTNAPPQLWMGKTVCDLPVSNGYITALAVELIKK